MGQPLPPAYVREVAGHRAHATACRSTSTAPGSGMRSWPSVPTASPPATWPAPADTVTFCLSKGLGCPVGSVLVGSTDFIWRARRARKLLGGGMRQVGVLAAAGLVALRDGDAGMIDRLADDHANARRLAEALADIDGISSAGGSAQPEPGRLDPGRVVTNFVLFKVERDRDAFLAALEARGVLMVDYCARPGPGRDPSRRLDRRHRRDDPRDARGARRDRHRRRDRQPVATPPHR